MSRSSPRLPIGSPATLLTAAMCLALSLGAACMAPVQNREEGLTRAAREFNDNLRWGRYEHVARYLSDDDSRALLVRKADLGDDFAMAENDLTSIKFEPGSRQATVVADFTWYNQRRALLRKSTIEQTWTWNGVRWTVAEQRRLRGDRFPLVPERLSQAAHTTPAPPSAPTPR